MVFGREIVFKWLSIPANRSDRMQISSEYPVLAGIDGPLRGQIFILQQPLITIGRGNEKKPVIVLPSDVDKSVSRLHTSLELTKLGYVIWDMGGPNTTRVNQQLIGKDKANGVTLNDGDVIQIGRTTFQYRIASNQVHPTIQTQYEQVDKRQVTDLFINNFWKRGKKIGSGSFGSVYEGYILPENKKVAIKIPHREFATDPQMLKVFRNECAIGKLFNHPNIIRVLNYGINNNVPYMMMEFLHGQTLREYINLNNGYPLDYYQAISLTMVFCNALQHIHEKDIIHRDLKPTNIMSDKLDDKTFKIMDFGIAKAKGITGITRFGKIVGTPEYMSPEHIMGVKDLDNRSDIYALGVLAYEMLTGRLPFLGRIEEVVIQHVKKPVPPLRQFNGNISSQLEAVILKALAKDRNYRYRSMNDFMNAIHSVTGVPIPDVKNKYAAISSLRLDGPEQTTIPLSPQKKYLIGKDQAKCNIYMHNVQYVSAVHAQIFWNNDGYVIEDLHSSNGTFVNEFRIHERHYLQPGDRISIGEKVFICF